MSSIGDLLGMEKNIKMLPDHALAQMLQDPQSPVPAFMVLGELQNRQKLRAGQQSDQMSPRSMKEEVMSKLGPAQPPGLSPAGPMPSAGIGGMPPPPSGPMQKMASGGIVKFAGGRGVYDQYGEVPLSEEDLDVIRRTGASRVEPSTPGFFKRFMTNLGSGISETAPYPGWMGEVVMPPPGIQSVVEPRATPSTSNELVGPPREAMGRGITETPVDVTTLLNARGRGGGGAPTIGHVDIGKYTPTEREAYLKQMGPHPEQHVPGLDESAALAAQYQQQHGFDFEPYRAEQEARRRELDETRKENRNMAMFKLGIGMMGTKRPDFLGGVAEGGEAATNYLTKAREAERQELQAIREGDFKLAKAAHEDKIAWINAANGEMRAKSAAKYEAAKGQYGAGITAIGLAEQDRRAALAHQVKQAEMNQAADIANARNQTALSAASISATRGSGNQVYVNQQVIKDAVKGAEAAIAQIRATPADALKKDKAAYRVWKDLQDPRKEKEFIDNYVRKRLEAPGVAYTKGDINSVYRGLGNQDIDLSNQE